MWKDELKKKWYLWDYNPEFGIYTTCQEEVIEFIESLLKQQREICATVYINEPVNTAQAILDAPEPKGKIK